MGWFTSCHARAYCDISFVGQVLNFLRSYGNIRAMSPSSSDKEYVRGPRHLFSQCRRRRTRCSLFKQVFAKSWPIQDSQSVNKLFTHSPEELTSFKTAGRLRAAPTSVQEGHAPFARRQPVTSTGLRCAANRVRSI